MSDCKHFGMCGGCAYRDVPYEEQLKKKENEVRELIKEYIDDDCVWEGILPSPAIEGYRNKMEFSFGDSKKDGPLELGMHRKGSFYDIVTVDECKIVDADYRKIISETVAYFRGKETPYYHKKSHQGYLRHLLVRKGKKTGEILVDLVTSSQKPADTICCEQGLLEDYVNLLTGLKLEGTIVGILNTINDSMSDAVKNDRTDLLYGRDHFFEELLGLKFRITPFSFFQTNSLSAEVIYSKAREYVRSGDNKVGSVSENSSKCCEDNSINGGKNVNNEKHGDETKYKNNSVINNDVILSNTTNVNENGNAGTDAKDGTSTDANNCIGENAYSSVDEDGKDNECKFGTVFDLYSGTGTIAQLIAPAAKKVIGVEIIEEAVESAKENTALNGLTNCDFIAGDVLKVIDDIKEKPDYIILDPPRDGVNPKALRKIMDYSVDNILYISCKPQSLARDLQMLNWYYKPVKVCVIDQFPFTKNVETVCLLSRK